MVPAGRFPEPPGSGVQIRPRAPPLLRYRVCLATATLMSKALDS